MSANLDLDALTILIDQGDIDTIIVATPDMQGRLQGKRVTGTFFLDTVIEGSHTSRHLLAQDYDNTLVPGYADANWETGYGDFVIKPDLTTLRRIPWLPGTALVLADACEEDGSPIPHAPRNVLKRQIERLSQHKLVANMASEIEFYLFDNTFAEARDQHYRDLKTAGWYIGDNQIFQGLKEESFQRAVRSGLEGAGIPVESTKSEWGPGQVEVNVQYSEAMEMADRHIIMKNALKEIAYLQGKSVTFMAKWNNDLAGNSCHVHLSLWDRDRNKAVFHDPKDERHMSETCRKFLAGMIATANDAAYFFAPNINSYKRFELSSFAPTNTSWSYDNRTTGFRICGHEASLRIESRLAGADANPYLSFAALIAGGLHGIENDLALPAPTDGNAYRASRPKSLPMSLREALDQLEGSAVMRAAFGDDVIDHYVNAGRWEQSEYDRVVTDWELIRGFERG